MIPPDVQLMIDKICRSCMCESAEMNNVFEKYTGSEQETILLSEMLMSCAQIQVVSGDGLPYLLCSDCESKLNTAFEFKLQCEKSDYALRELTNKPLAKNNDDKTTIRSDLTKVVSDSDEDDVPLKQQTRVEKIKDNECLICEYCHKRLPGKRALRVHTSFHKNDGTRYCPACPSKYTRLTSLQSHMKKHNKEWKKFSCVICAAQFHLIEDLYQHLDMHKEELTSSQVKPIKVKIEVKEESDDVTYELADKVTDKSSEEIRIEIEANQKRNEDDLDSMDIPLDQFPFSDNDDEYDTELENIDKKRKRGRPRKYDPKEGFPCSICGKVLTTNLGRRIHLRTHGIKSEPPAKRRLKKVVKLKEDVKQIVECEFCDRQFKYRKSYSQHMRLEHDMTLVDGDFDNLLTVQLDEESDPNATTNNNQIEEGLVAENKELSVNGAEEESKQDNSSASTSTLMRIKSIENVDLDDNTKTFNKKKIHECLVCGSQFSRPNHLTRHMTFHRAILTHKCEMCNQSFHKDELLKQHVEDEHANKPYVCSFCKKSFTRGEHLIRHLKVHRSDTAIDPKCCICDTKFSRMEHLVRHIKGHLMQDKRHSCLDCGKSFNRLDNLKTHQKVHTGVKEASKLHLCVYCGKEFNNSSNMIVHMRRHTGERPYKCSVCDKGFPRSHDLKCHERTHSGEKPYLCTLCGKSFNKSNKLLRHSRVHTGERPYVCNVCGRAFTQSNDLSLHMRRHTGARPYACGVCPARFIQSGQLKHHRRQTDHWMETQPDLKGGHRVEPVSGPIEHVPIRFKKYCFPTKKEVIEEDIPETVMVTTDEPETIQVVRETISNNQPHKLLMGIGIMGKLSQNDMQSLVIDSGKLVELQGSGLGIMTLPTVIQGTNREQIKLKTELGTFSMNDVEGGSSKAEIVESHSDTYPENSEAYTAVSTSTTYTTAEEFEFQTFN